MTKIDQNVLVFRKSALKDVEESIKRIRKEKEQLDFAKVSLLWEPGEPELLQAITDEIRQVEILYQALGKVFQANTKRLESQE